MISIPTITQLVLSLTIYNVWILRFKRATPWRGGDAKTMRDEFLAYGLSPSLVWVVGFLKIASATGLILGLWYPALTRVSATVLAVLMVAAVAMHFKVRDPAKKSLPAACLFLAALYVALSA